MVLVVSYSTASVPVKLNNGSLLVGTFINLMLYTLELVQGYRYYMNRNRNNEDKLLIKVCVALNLLSDTIGTVASCALIFLYTVIYWGETDRVDRGTWSLVVVLATSSFSAVVVQCFMIHRYFNLSRNYVVAAFLLLLVVTGLWGIVQTTIASSRHPVITERHEALRFVVVGLAFDALADVSITISLLWQLHRYGAYSQSMSSLLHRISILTIKTGTIPSLMAIACLISFLIRPDTQVSVAIFLLLGRVYTSTMLFSLNHRAKLRESWTKSDDINLTGIEATRTSSQGSPSVNKNDRDKITYVRRKRLELATAQRDVLYPSGPTTATSQSHSLHSTLPLFTPKSRTGHTMSLNDIPQLEIVPPPSALTRANSSVA